MLHCFIPWIPEWAVDGHFSNEWLPHLAMIQSQGHGFPIISQVGSICRTKPSWNLLIWQISHSYPFITMSWKTLWGAVVAEFCPTDRCDRCILVSYWCFWFSVHLWTVSKANPLMRCQVCRIDCQIHEARISWDLEYRDLNFCATICMGIYENPLLEQTLVAMNDS